MDKRLNLYKNTGKNANFMIKCKLLKENSYAKIFCYNKSNRKK